MKGTSNIFKTNGLKFFHPVLSQVINILAREQKYTMEAMKKCLLSAQDYLPTEIAGVLKPEFWQERGEAGRLNEAGITQLIADFSDALIRANSNNNDIEI